MRIRVNGVVLLMSLVTGQRGWGRRGRLIVV